MAIQSITYTMTLLIMVLLGDWLQNSADLALNARFVNFSLLLFGSFLLTSSFFFTVANTPDFATIDNLRVHEL